MPFDLIYLAIFKISIAIQFKKYISQKSLDSVKDKENSKNTFLI